MSARNPLGFLTKQIKQLRNTAYYIKKLRSDEAIGDYVVENLAEATGLTDQQLLRFCALQILKSKAIDDPDDEQQSLFADCEDVFFSMKIGRKAGQIALADVDESTMPAILQARQANIDAARHALAKLETAWLIIQPILANNDGWKWRDAVKWLEANGGIPA